MSNNSSVLPLEFNETSVPEFAGPLLCVLWHLRNQTMSYSQAEEACSMYFEEFGTGTAVMYWLAAVIIIILNAAVLWGIVGNRELYKTYYFYMANLSVADILAGIALLCYATANLMEVTSLYSRMKITTAMISSQLMSASGLALQSGNSYVVVRHPIFHHVHAHEAKRNAAVAIVLSWLVLFPFSLTPSMGWNCLDMPTSNSCTGFYHTAYLGIVGATLALLAITALFTTTSAFIAIKQSQNNRPAQPAGGQPLQVHNPAQNSQIQPHNPPQDGRRLTKIKTVITHVALAFTFWLLPLVLTPACRSNENCPLPTGPRGLMLIMTLNSAINPIVSIIRTPDLRKGIWKNMTAIYRAPTALVTMIRGNRDSPQDGQQVPPMIQGNQDSPQDGQQVPPNTPHKQGAEQNTPNVQGGATHGAEQNTPADQPAAEHTPVNLAMASTGTALPEVITWNNKTFVLKELGKL